MCAFWQQVSEARFYVVFTVNDEVSGGLRPVRWSDLLDASLLFLISRGIFQDSQDYQFPSQRLNQASTGDSHEAIERFVWNSMSGL